MPFSVYLPAGGAVPTQRYFWIFRAFQLLFAFLILVLTSYALSVYQGGPIRPALVATIVISVFTMIPILPLVAPLHDIQDKIYDPCIALLLETIATLFWLAAFSALASYQDNYSAYGSDDALVEPLFRGCTKCRHAWRAGEAVTAFSILEFLLFLCTTILSLHLYHSREAGKPSGIIPVIPHNSTDPTAAETSNGAGTAPAFSRPVGDVPLPPPHTHAHHGKENLPAQSQQVVPNTAGLGGNTASGALGGGVGGEVGGQTTGPPYPAEPPRQGGYGGYVGV